MRATRVTIVAGLLFLLSDAACPAQTGFVEAPWAGPVALNDSWTVGHFDGDGRADLAIIPTTTAGAPGRLEMSVPGGGWSPLYFAFPAGLTASKVFAADIDSNLSTDLLAGTSTVPLGWQVTALLSLGPGWFLNGPVTLLPGVLNLLGAGDFTGDGVPDLLASTTAGVRVFPGTSGGAFSQNLAAVPPATLPGPAQILDLDGDLDLDVLLADPLSGIVTYLNSGSGILVRAAPVPGLLPGWPTAAGDIDGDGFADLISISGTAALVMRGSGGGGYYAWAALPLGIAAGSVRTLAMEDFDGDGHADLLLLTDSPSPWSLIQVYESATGLVAPGPVLPSAPIGAIGAGTRLVAADIESDLDLDVVIAGGGQPPLQPFSIAGRALLNLRNGGHGGRWATYPGGCPGGAGPVLSALSAPSPGASLVLSVTGGPVLAPGLLVASTEGAQWLPPTGCVFAVGWPAPVLIPHTLSGAGAALFSFPLPPGAALSGIRLFVQDVVPGPPPSGTNGILLVF